jgi:hypothetical protein
MVDNTTCLVGKRAETKTFAIDLSLSDLIRVGHQVVPYEGLGMHGALGRGEK